MIKPLRCSIIINTHNRAAHLEKLLAAFHHLTYNHFEVVVVNGPSTDETEALLEQYAGRVKLVSCPETNLSRSRNLGIAAAAGDIVVFIDDDALPGDSAWLDKIVSAFQKDIDGRIGAAGGDALHRDTPHYEFRGGFTSDYGLQIFRQEETNGPSLDEGRWVRRTVGCNSAFRRSALEAIGGFDEHFIYYLDESDVCLRLSRHGYKTVYLADCPVRHYAAHSTHGAPFLRNRRIITQSDTYYCLKNGADRPFKRFLKTLRLAPTKHFVQEMPQLWRNRQISLAQLFIFFAWQWLRGLLAGLWLGLYRSRQIPDKLNNPPEFLPFVKNTPAQKLCICLITEKVPPYSKIGGVERYTYDLAKGLHELGHEIHVICQSDVPVRRDSLAFTIHGIATHEYINSNLFPGKPVLNKNVGYALAVSSKLANLTGQGITIDVVHATNWNLCGLALPLLRAFPYVLVLVSPLAEIIETQDWLYTDDLRAYLALDRWQIEKADSLVCPSWGVLEAYRTKMGLDINRLPIHKVQLGIVPAFHASQPVKKSNLHKLLFVGRLEYRKGAHILLEVLPALLTIHQDWQCDLVGDDQIVDVDGKTLKEKFLTKYRHAAWLKRVHFHSAVSDEALQEFYQSCDLFVAPSLFESFGIIYPEAMQYGKPVVGCRTGGIPEIVTDGVDGLLVEPGDSTALASTLDRLMREPELRRNLGQAGLKKVHETLNYLAMAERMATRYYEVIISKDKFNHQHLRQHQANQDILFDGRKVEQRGEWHQKELEADQLYLFSNQPDASLSFEAPGSSSLSLVTLCHDSSGVVTISFDKHLPVHLDLFNGQLQLAKLWELKVPGTPGDQVKIQIKVHPERNPESKDNQVWLKTVFLAFSHLD